MLRNPSCGARKNLRAAAFPRFFRPLRQPLLAVSATGGAYRPPACGARNGRCSLSLAPFRPLRQRLLAVSAVGGASRRCPARGFGAAVGKMEHQANPPLLQPFGCTQGRVDALLMLLYFGTPAGQLPGSLFFTITTAATAAGKTMLPN